MESQKKIESRYPCAFSGCGGRGKWRPWVTIPALDPHDDIAKRIDIEFDLLVCDYHQKEAEKEAFLTTQGVEFLRNYVSLHNPSVVLDMSGTMLNFREVYPTLPIIIGD